MGLAIPSPATRRILEAAMAEAAHQNSAEVKPIHLLHGLLVTEETTALKLLGLIGADLDALRNEVAGRIRGTGIRLLVRKDPPWALGSRAVMEKAATAAARLESEFIRSEWLLCSLALVGDAETVALMETHGATLSRLRLGLDAFIAGCPSYPAHPPDGRAGLREFQPGRSETERFDPRIKDALEKAVSLAACGVPPLVEPVDLLVTMVLGRFPERLEVLWPSLDPGKLLQQFRKLAWSRGVETRVRPSPALVRAIADADRAAGNALIDPDLMFAALLGRLEASQLEFLRKAGLDIAAALRILDRPERKEG